MSNHPWWQRAVIYEIVVPSFQDANGDGYGDLAGITSRLDYLQWLGVDALWLTPIFTSPMYDLGYDSAAFDQIDPLFGQLDDLHTLLREAHARQLRIILDFVPNHTSVSHPWFKASRASRHNEYRDWFLWCDGQRHGKPPNNWINRFGRSAWTLDETTGQYYLGSFSDQQPDLNWRHPSVRAAIHEAVRYWLNLGVDGLRIDALAHLIKDLQLRDNPINPYYSDQDEPSNRLALHFNQNQPELLEVIEELRSVFDEYPDRLFLGEVYQSPEQIAAYQKAGTHLLLNTAVLQTSFEAIMTRNIVDLIESRTSSQAWPSHCSGNHDIGRLAHRLKPEQLRQAALLLFTLRGTPTMYYGEELGMGKYEIPHDRMRDPSGQDTPQYGRDGHRTPMPWTPDAQASFQSIHLGCRCHPTTPSWRLRRSNKMNHRCCTSISGCFG